MVRLGKLFVHQLLNIPWGIYRMEVLSGILLGGLDSQVPRILARTVLPFEILPRTLSTNSNSDATFNTFTQWLGHPFQRYSPLAGSLTSFAHTGSIRKIHTDLQKPWLSVAVVWISSSMPMFTTTGDSEEGYAASLQEVGGVDIENSRAMYIW